MIPRSERIIAGVAAFLFLALLVVGAVLRPAPAGHGTHEQLGMAPCPFLEATGIPCFTCGMTTAVTLAAHARPVDAFITQPFGAALALAAAVAFWGCAHVAVFGSRLGRVVEPLLRPRILWVLAALATAAWVYKMVTWPAAA